jgi:hypothetical protein
VGDQHALDRPGQDPVDRGPRGASIKEREAPIDGRAGVGLDDAAEMGKGAAPPGAPVPREVLDQVGENRGAAGAVEEDHLGHREAAADQDLIDVIGPRAIRRVAEVGIEAEIRAAAAQAGRGVEARLGIGGLPFAQEEVVQLVGRDDVTNRPAVVHRSAQGRRQRDGGPREQRAVGQPDQCHARWVRKAEHEGDDRAFGDPDLRAEGR